MAFILLFPLLLSLTSSAVTAAVLDTNGQPLRPGVGYYILPVIRGRGGGLATAPLGNNTCPLYVAQASLEVSNGLPVKLYPANARAPFVELSADANFVFSGATICVQSMVWRLDSVRGTRFVGISGTKGNPSGSTIGSWFKVERYGSSDYKLVFCPAVCNTCRPACGDLGVVVNGGRRYLVVGGGSAFPVMFKKA